MRKIPFLSLISVLACTVSLSAALTYQAVPAGAVSGSVDVYDPLNGVEYGKARITWAYWQDNDNYWHYSYQIINNGHPVDDPSIHFGWYDIGMGTTTYDSINKFSIALLDGSLYNGAGPSELAAGTNAGAATGAGAVKGDAWAVGIDPGNIGVDWTLATSGGSTPLPIAPSRWEWKRIGGKYQWVVTAGDVSTTDANAEYFHLVSSWAPDWVEATLTTTSQATASGLVMGPAIIPEPASLVILALGSLVVVAGKNRRHI